MKCLLLLLGIGLTSGLFAASWTDDNNVTWNYTLVDGEAWLGSTSSSSSWSYTVATSSTGALALPDTIDDLYPVVGIAPYAFYRRTGVTSVTIPGGIRAIGASAFYGCTGLTSVSLPEGLLIVGSYAFYSCTGLTSVTLPEGVQSLGSNAFASCSKLTSVSLPEGLTTLSSNVFASSGLTSVTFPSTLTAIASQAFYQCTGLSSITLPASLTSLGTNAFYSCTSLTSVTFQGEPPTSYGSNIFYAGTSSSSSSGGPGGNMGGWGGGPGSSGSTTAKTQYGYYSPSYASAWTAVISSGKWDNLTMSATDTYALEASIVGFGSVSGTGLYAEGASVTLTASADAGYAFYGWLDGDGTWTQDETLTLTMPAATQTVTAYFLPIETLTATLSNDALTASEAADQILSTATENPVFTIENGDVLTLTLKPQSTDSQSGTWETIDLSSVTIDTTSGALLLTFPKGEANFFRFTVPDAE